VFADVNGTKQFETGFVRFSFVADEESQFNFYNVHLHPEIFGSVEAATALISFAESVKLGGHATYPPLVVGDFNGGPERFPTFDTLGAVDVDHVIGGQRASHPATNGFSVVGTVIAPGAAPNPDAMCAPREVAWSDHCGLVVTIEPAP
jgi:endonuclease/exonuclease/phosphatase family metal-dependent hydrolase